MAVTIAAVLFALLRAGPEGEDEEPRGASPAPRVAEDDPYFLRYRHLLSEPSEELEHALSLRLASWELPTAAGEPNPPRWFVLLENADPQRQLRIVDVLLVPSPATAPGVRLQKEDLTTLVLEPGASEQVEVVTPIEHAPDVTPAPPEEDVFGMHLYAVVAFPGEAPPPAPPPTPESDDAFERIWGDYALVGSFAEIPPDVLTLLPRD